MLGFNPPISLQTKNVNSKTIGKMPTVTKDYQIPPEVVKPKLNFKKLKKLSRFIMIPVIICILIGLILLIYHFKSQIKAIHDQKVSVAEPKPIDWTANWKVFHDERLGLEFKYTEDIFLKQEEKAVSLERGTSKILSINETTESLSQFLTRYIVKSEKVDNSQVIPEVSEIGGRSAEEVTVKTENGNLLTCEYVEVDRLSYEVCIYPGLTEEVKQILGTVKFF